MLITLWKTEGHKKKVLKKDKFELMLRTLTTNNLSIKSTSFLHPLDMPNLIINTWTFVAKSSTNFQFKWPYFPL